MHMRLNGACTGATLREERTYVKSGELRDGDNGCRHWKTQSTKRRAFKFAPNLLRCATAGRPLFERRQNSSRTRFCHTHSCTRDQLVTQTRRPSSSRARAAARSCEAVHVTCKSLPGTNHAAEVGWQNTRRVCSEDKNQTSYERMV